LARLSVADDRDAAKVDLDQARKLYQHAAEEDTTDATSQIAWLESELFSATMAGFDGGQGELSRAADISTALQSAWPTDPDKIYRLACSLAGRDPLLVKSN
jgi:hypothetical protein